MTDVVLDALDDLLRASLGMWSVSDNVELARSENQIIVKVDNESIVSISRAPAGMPFRWGLVVNDRQRTAASVVGVLRIVRQTLAPGYQPYQLNIAPLPGHPE